MTDHQNASIVEKQKAFEALVMPTNNGLYALAIRLTKNKHEAEDLLQDTYFKAYRVFDSFRHGTNFQGWTARIMVNAFITDYNKRKNIPMRANFGDTCVTYLAERIFSRIPRAR